MCVLKKDFCYNGYNFLKGICVCFVLDFVLMDLDIFLEFLKFKLEWFLDKDGKCIGELKEKFIFFLIGEKYKFFIIVIYVDSIVFY